jgi:hypothetical protein
MNGAANAAMQGFVHVQRDAGLAVPTAAQKVAHDGLLDGLDNSLKVSWGLTQKVHDADARGDLAEVLELDLACYLKILNGKDKTTRRSSLIVGHGLIGIARARNFFTIHEAADALESFNKLSGGTFADLFSDASWPGGRAGFVRDYQEAFIASYKANLRPPPGQAVAAGAAALMEWRWGWIIKVAIPGALSQLKSTRDEIERAVEPVQEEMKRLQKALDRMSSKIVSGVSERARSPSGGRGASSSAPGGGQRAKGRKVCVPWLCGNCDDKSCPELHRANKNKITYLWENYRESFAEGATLDECMKKKCD